ncbi:MAG TPA: serine/threonine-protein kinase [Gemmata sp.]
MAAIAPVSVTDLLDLLRKSGILAPARLKEVPGPDALPADPRKAAAALVQQGFITKFQSAQLLVGRHKGFRIGPYAVQDLLGRGGMGAVYLAEHLELRRKVAIKVLAPVRGDGAKLAAERFMREGRAAAALDHPNIVRVLDVTRHNDTPYLVMEFVDGETLQQTLDRDGTVPPEMAAEYIAQTASGLQHAHERGLIHRDIKPGNLMRDRFGAVKILDMGLARTGDDRDKLTEQLDHGAVVGTADFISPEQAINNPNIDGRADLYSLGATLFTLLVGKPPFEGNTTQKLMQHQLKEAPPVTALRPGVPAGLAEVAARMLAKKPADRYQTAAEVVAALAPWVGSSARVLAGLSRTNIGSGPDSFTSLGDRSQGSSLRLGAPQPGDSAEFDFSTPTRATVALSASETARSLPPAPAPVPVPAAPPVAARAPEPRAGRGRLLLALGLALVVLSAGIGLGWLVFGR